MQDQIVNNFCFYFDYYHMYFYYCCCDDVQISQKLFNEVKNEFEILSSQKLGI